MKMSRILLALVIGVAGCDKEGESEPTIGAKYLDQVLDFMEENSIKRKTIDWPTFKDNAREKGKGAVTAEDAYPAIIFAIRALGDHHSFFLKSDGSFLAGGFDLVCDGYSSFVGNLNNIGYVKVNGFSGSGADAFAKALHTSIKEQDKADITGWIVDLRGNTGGNMWPMISGIGPILGQGTLGYFIDPDENQTQWTYETGRSLAGGIVQHSVAEPYTLLKQNPKVAVLIDARTASSGEATAIAFIGRPNTKLFGLSTCGLSTSNRGFTCMDGATLILTTSVMADRNKDKKGGPLPPDVTVAGDFEVVNKAVEWLNQP